MTGSYDRSDGRQPSTAQERPGKRAGAARLAIRPPRAAPRALPLLALVAAAACDSTGPERPPDPPAAVAAVPASDRRITVMWALPTEEVERVEVERSEDSGPFLPVTTLEGPATTLVDEDLAPATTYRYRVRVCNEGGCSPFAPKASATTFSALRLTTTTLPSAVVGVAYQASLGATGGNGQLAFSLAGGALPPGISLASDGTLSGTPTAAGTFAFQVRATSADGQSSTAELVLFVRDVLVITTSTLPGGVVGRSYSAAINAVGGDSAYTWFVDAGTSRRGSPSPTAAFSPARPTASRPRASPGGCGAEMARRR